VVTGAPDPFLITVNPRCFMIVLAVVSFAVGAIVPFPNKMLLVSLPIRWCCLSDTEYVSTSWQFYERIEVVADGILKYFNHLSLRLSFLFAKLP
jgi:hypothetical protein